MKLLIVECCDEMAAGEILRFVREEGPSVYSAHELPSAEELGRVAMQVAGIIAPRGEAQKIGDAIVARLRTAAPAPGKS